MANLFSPIRKTVLRKSRPLFLLLNSQRQLVFSFDSLLPRMQSPSLTQSRNYITEMRKSAFEGNILRLLRNEIQYELDRSPLEQQVKEFNGFMIDERPGEQWIRLEKKFGENEEIKAEVTMFDGSVPVSKSVDGKSSKIGEEVQLHITLIVSTFKEEYDKVLELVCSAWPDSLEIDRVYVRARAQMPHQPYVGPPFKELDDRLQESLYEYLEVRGVDDALCAFLHNYMKFKDRSEFTGWMTNVKSFIEKKAAE
ncbi:hypothetical protein Nepgr_019541 [Nepenthes gracilis]|uniref:Mitochondrial glycoprotein n=1 Tax=Nepenthes gracilis TaxID=150966 RepID=A0AAD3XVC4_NEPGR|nr:hypothetical protein Nepgr_019541 [Nepenthes gracilis]